MAADELLVGGKVYVVVTDVAADELLVGWMFIRHLQKTIVRCFIYVGVKQEGDGRTLKTIDIVPSCFTLSRISKQAICNSLYFGDVYWIVTDVVADELLVSSLLPAPP